MPQEAEVDLESGSISVGGNQDTVNQERLQNGSTDIEFGAVVTAPFGFVEIPILPLNLRAVGDNDFPYGGKLESWRQLDDVFPDPALLFDADGNPAAPFVPGGMFGEDPDVNDRATVTGILEQSEKHGVFLLDESGNLSYRSFVDPQLPASGIGSDSAKVKLTDKRGATNTGEVRTAS